MLYFLILFALNRLVWLVFSRVRGSVKILILDCIWYLILLPDKITLQRFSFPDDLFELFTSCYLSIITMYNLIDNIDLPLQGDFLLWLPACKQPVHLGDRRSDSWTDTSCWGTFTRTFCGFCPSLSQTVTSALLLLGDWWKHRIRHRVQ